MILLRDRMRRPRRRTVNCAAMLRTWPSRCGSDLHQVEEHQTSVQWAVPRDVAVLPLLFLGAEHKTEPVAEIVFARHGFVVSIDHEIAASRLVVFVYEPALDAVHQLGSDVLAHKFAVHAEAPNQNGGIDHVALLLRNSLADSLFPCIRKVVCENAGIGHRECADNFPWIRDLKERVRFSHQLPGIVQVVRGEELVKILVSATKWLASGNYALGERNTEALVLQKGHLPAFFKAVMRRAFSVSKSRQSRRTDVKSTHPRLRAFFCAARTNRRAASPDRTGMLLIASAISNEPFGEYYSKTLCAMQGHIFEKFGMEGAENEQY